jgi:glycine cleavage system pyridoxal-binding protein P
MKDEKAKELLEKIDAASIEELERKLFPKSHERKNREKAMKDPKLFEEHLKEKLRKCMIKK